MASSAVSIATLIFMSIGNILTLVCIAIPYWQRNDPQDTINDNIIRHRGIWIKCQTLPTGNWDCDDFNSFFLGLPTQLQAARGLSLTSIFLGVLGMVAMIIGLDAVKCGADDKTTKKRIRLVAGILTLLAGLLITAAVSWYANDVRLQHELETQTKLLRAGSVQRMIFGEALFLGWVGGAFMVLAGLFGMCTGCGGSESYEDGPRGYVYRPPKSASGGQEYV